MKKESQKKQISTKQIQEFAKTILKQEKLTEILSFFVKDFSTIASNQFIDKYVVPNKQYTYFLVVEHEQKERVIYQSSIETNTTIAIPSPIAKSVRIFYKEKTVKIHFQPLPLKTGVIGYNIYRKRAKDKQYTRLNQYPIFFMKPIASKKAQKENQIQYIDSNLENHQEYYYQIQSVHFSGAVSDFTPPKNVLYKISEPVKNS